VRFAVLAQLKRHLGGGRRLAELEQAGTGGCEVVEANALELLQERRVLGAERKEGAAVAGVGAAVEMVLAEPSYAERARALADELRAEPPVDEAVPC